MQNAQYFSFLFSQIDFLVFWLHTKKIGLTFNLIVRNKVIGILGEIQYDINMSDIRY